MKTEEEIRKGEKMNDDERGDKRENEEGEWEEKTFLFTSSPCCTVQKITPLQIWLVHEKPTTVQPLKKFLASYKTRRFITVVTRARHWSLSWARWVNTLTFCQSQSWFTTGGLPPISSPWRQASWGSWSEFFLQINPYGHNPCVTSSRFFNPLQPSGYYMYHLL
jgi:hypothetical protein